MTHESLVSQRAGRRLSPDADVATGAHRGVGKRTLVEATDVAPAVSSAAVQRRGADRAPASAPDAVKAAAAHGTSGAASALPHLDRIQRLFGRHDVSGVRAHVGGNAAEGAAAMGAQAFATGDQVAFAGTPDLHTAAHEAAHVVQQRGGVQLKGGVGAVGDPYECHADAVADLVVQGRSAEALLDARSGHGSPAAGAAVQRKVEWTGYFDDHDDDPPVHEEDFHLGRWMELQVARTIFSRADRALRGTLGSLLDVFDAEPKVTLVITSRDNMPKDHAGNTMLEIMDGSDKVFVDPSTAKRWGPLAASGAAAIITVGLDSRGKGGQAAYTLNHEMAMHATEFLQFVRAVRAGAGDPLALADRYLGMHHDHHKTIHDPASRVNATHNQMLAVAEAGDRAAMEDAYFEDKEQYSPDGHTEEAPRQGHGPGESWKLPRLSATSPAAGLELGEERTVVHKRVRMRIKRLDKQTFHIWCASNQVKPYVALVAEIDE